MKCITASPSRDYIPPTPPRSGWVGYTYKLHIGFKRESWEWKTRTKAKLSTKRLGEGWGGRFRPYGLVTYAFSRLRCKSTAPALAAGACIGAGVGRRRAFCEVRRTMTLYKRIYESEAQPDAGTEGSLR